MMRLDLIFGGEAESRFRLKVIILVFHVSGLLLDWQSIALHTLHLWSAHFRNLQVSHILQT